MESQAESKADSQFIKDFRELIRATKTIRKKADSLQHALTCDEPVIMLQCPELLDDIERAVADFRKRWGPDSRNGVSP